MKGSSILHSGKICADRCGWCFAGGKHLVRFMGWIVLFPFLSILMLPAAGWGVQPSIAGGGYHTVALKNDGTVRTWGQNDNGQLGDNTTTDRVTPVQVTGAGGAGFLTGMKGVSAGFLHTLALKNDGTVWAWGYNMYGQLGDNTSDNRTAPVQVKGPGGAGFLTGMKAVSAGYAHSMALKTDGTVWAWGYNYIGQLGDNTHDGRTAPVQVKGPGGAGFLTDVTGISAGGDHSAAVKEDGTVWAWGSNSRGQLGDGTTTSSESPVQVLGPGGVGFLTGVKAVHAGRTHTVVLKDDGTVWAWGDNENGQLGDDTTTERVTPVQVVSTLGAGFLADITAIAAGDRHTAALMAGLNAGIWTWGENQYGELGIDDTGDRDNPDFVRGPDGTGSLDDVRVIAMGYWHMLAVKNDGSVWAWGRNGDGQLGDNTTTNRDTPVQVLGPGGAGTLDLGFFDTHDYYLPYYTSESGYWTGVGLKNGNPSFTASVTTTVYESTGAVLDSHEASLSPRGQTAFMAGSGLEKDGWVKVTSNEPLTGLGFVAMTADERLMFDMTLISTLMTTLYVPHVAQDATWDTIVYVCNPHGSAATMYLTFFDSAGTAVSTSPIYTLPADGSGSYPLSDLLGGASYTSGSVRITASQGVGAFALYHNLKTGDRSYAGISAVIPPKTLVMPGSTYSYCLPYALSDTDYWTGVGLRNGSTSGNASVTVTGITQEGSAFDTQTKTIPPSGQTAFMMGRGEGWVRITSDKPLTGLGFVAMTGDDKLMFDMTFISKAATMLYVPHVAQDATWDTIVYVCNPNDSEVSMNLKLVGSDGTVVYSCVPTIQARGSRAFPLSELVGAVSYTSGSVEITASQGVGAFALYHNLKTGARSYAGISAVEP